ncbi:AfsR/SARP family transcriptional regulator [Lentzea tibetensis]|uniref:AfsR/SARP family transcriptional regulator n=1 Tax=Lentzea tibetensis TaxID=2591470 RepID=UPI001645436D|nr:AfsR/SARP family transcriptional regulator [Lentzea tibetensis]
MGTLLTVLLLRANHQATLPEIVDYLWGQSPPAHSRSAVQTCVSRLRRALGEHPSRRLIRTTACGYLIELDPTQLDLTRFRRLVDRAALARGPAERADLLGHALALWRGQPLSDLTAESLLRDSVPTLVEERLHAVESWMDARLHLGHEGHVIAQLTTLTREYPLRERFWAQLMLALYRCGRQAEALAVYRTAAARLSEEVGVDPGRELQALQRRILAGDPGLSSDATPTRSA